jgi:urease accessory protein
MRRALVLAALLLPLPALAHPGGHEAHGVVAGLLHPVGGLDHVVAMVAVGLWAGLIGGRALLLPAAFLGGMTLGAALGMAGVPVPLVEHGILASMIVLGGLVAAAVRLPAAAAMAVAAVFGLLHGHAHGTEMVGGALGYAAGVLVATAALHAAGLGLARLLDRSGARLATRAAGAAGALAGIALLLG